MHSNSLLRFIPAIVALGVATAAFAAGSAARRPNILFIYADDQSYKTLSCSDGGPDWVRTPNIDRLAARGVPWYAMLRDGKYKYVRNLVEGEMEELYDLDADPEELKNLAVQPAHAAGLRQLREKTVLELKRTDAKFVDRMPRTRAELAR